MDWWTWLLLAEGGAFLFSLWFARWDAKKSDLKEYKETGKLPKTKPGSVLAWALAITVFFPLFLVGSVIWGVGKMITSDMVTNFLAPSLGSVEAIEAEAKDQAEQMQLLFKDGYAMEDGPSKDMYMEMVEALDKSIKEKIPADRRSEIEGYRSFQDLKAYPLECNDCTSGHVSESHFSECHSCGETYCPYAHRGKHGKGKCVPGEPKPAIEKPKKSAFEEEYGISEKEVIALAKDTGLSSIDITRAIKKGYSVHEIRKEIKSALEDYHKYSRWGY
ncbi:hypothetical protein HOT82_gp025 [Gordonia phage Ronaldo]|uniref:Uncharacterized protein n=1 Tax=Gordonia phage Ronaldo TaxID=2250397 RepID=A0A346FCX3_9CAUD|nr:hypothetical protein HOT82_gp025 [Gordonia phage Ronaldo]AXN53587.1 hypothetical protein SEA_RONALDO_25 [Gordonia phage Ronaldo]